MHIKLEKCCIRHRNPWLPIKLKFSETHCSLMTKTRRIMQTSGKSNGPRKKHSWRTPWLQVIDQNGRQGVKHEQSIEQSIAACGRGLANLQKIFRNHWTKVMQIVTYGPLLYSNDFCRFKLFVCFDTHFVSRAQHTILKWNYIIKLQYDEYTFTAQSNGTQKVGP